MTVLFYHDLIILPYCVIYALLSFRDVLAILLYCVSYCNICNSLSYHEHAVHLRFLPRHVYMGMAQLAHKLA